MEHRSSTARSTDKAPPEEKEVLKNRPENTKFKQQKLDAWQPILTPKWVIGTFLIVGLIFVPVGSYLLALSNDLFEAVVTYDSFDDSKLSSGISSSCQIDQINQGYDELVAGSRSFEDCQLRFTFDRDIAEKDTVFVYYEIENFYQNHRRYVKSVSESQLTGEVVLNPVTLLTDSSLSTSCDPSESFSNDDFFERIFYPCGLIALSVFNDGLSLSSFERDGSIQEYAAGIAVDEGEADISIDTNDIAWESDLANKYVNPTQTDCGSSPDLSSGGNLCPTRYFQYQYLWQTYNQFVCYAPTSTGSGIPDLSSPAPCLSYTDYVQELGSEVYGTGNWDAFVSGNSDLRDKNEFLGACARCANDGDVYVSAGGIPAPEDPTQAESREGVRNEGFIVWMRTAGLPTFRKLYGRLKAPPGGFKKGDSVNLTVVPNFLVSTISGSKSIIVGTTSPLGGKNGVLGVAYIAVGSVCLVLAAIFLLKVKFYPRKLGDPQYLEWKKK
mmetsp:Transcript_1014/g.1989  ORF Transcript_1014/g.1989 Transcript_1014/m.1989 type:complete len:497 (+) Transcript_1014:229-1719(+)